MFAHLQCIIGRISNKKGVSKKSKFLCPSPLRYNKRIRNFRLVHFPFSVFGQMVCFILRGTCIRFCRQHNTPVFYLMSKYLVTNTFGFITLVSLLYTAKLVLCSYLSIDTENNIINPTKQKSEPCHINVLSCKARLRYFAVYPTRFLTHLDENWKKIFFKTCL